MRLLLLLPFVGLLWLPFYNHVQPAWLGIPFFYWYQFATIPITSLILWVLYKREYQSEDE
nr:DUF3311 domain-containing protein [Carnimonas nigrificans]